MADRMPFDASALRLRVCVPASQDPEGPVRAALSGHQANHRLAAVVGNATTNPALAVRLFELLSSHQDLFLVDTERRQMDEHWLRLDFSKDFQQRLQALLALTLEEGMARTERRWLVRMINWLARHLLSPREFERANRSGRAQVMREREHHTLATVSMMLWHALAVELETTNPAMRQARFQIVCPGAPMPLLTLDMDRIRSAFTPPAQAVLHA